MRKFNVILAAIAGQAGLAGFVGLAVLNGCSSNTSQGGGSRGPGGEYCAGAVVGGTTVAPSSSGSNVLAIQVGGSSLCGTFANIPCVSVTVCTPGTQNCQVIPNILVDTGSSGLRIFSQALSVDFCHTLPQVKNAAGTPLGQCAQFGTGSDWGAVVTAGVQLGGESVVQVPIQLINSTYSNMPPNCGNVDTDPTQAGYNGILGVGIFQHDCGPDCESDANIGTYFGCADGNCAGSAISLASQVQNPVALLPADNNGVLIDLPAVANTGATAVNGSLILGIGTSGNNTPSGVTTLPITDQDNFPVITTIFNGTTYPDSFIDSGSNGYNFVAPTSMPECSVVDANNDFLCPASTTPFTNTNKPHSGSPTSTVTIQIANGENLFNSGNSVFNDLAANTGSDFQTSFDYGLPFFFGRKIYTILGTGWAY